MQSANYANCKIMHRVYQTDITDRDDQTDQILQANQTLEADQTLEDLQVDQTDREQQWKNCQT